MSPENAENTPESAEETETDPSGDVVLEPVPLGDISNSLSDSEDDYIVSEDEVSAVFSLGGTHGRFPYTSSLSDHAQYLSKTLDRALESLLLDKSLVIQAQLSGHINNENQQILDKRRLLAQKMETLKQLYNENFVKVVEGSTKVARLGKDIATVEGRVARLRDGNKGLGRLGGLFAASGRQGVAEKYPVEYNQARDKVLERQMED